MAASAAMPAMSSQFARGGLTLVLALMASITCVWVAAAQAPLSVPEKTEPQIEAQPPISRQVEPALPAPDSQPQVSPPQLSQPEAPPPRKPDGFFDALNRWMDKSAKDFKASVDESNAKWRALGEQSEKAAKDAAAAQKQAAEAFKNLSNVRLVEGRQICATAANGSPDCQAAAEDICRSKGFGKGQSADIQTTRKCSAKAYLTRDTSACRMESVVVKAACQ